MGGPVLFGVRHLSPAAAFHLRQALDRAKPALVLVEGPSDLNDQLKWLCHSETRFPAAILAYTQTPPVRTILYPFSIYSPEIQAILWANAHDVEFRFMDLPSSVFLALAPDVSPSQPEEQDPSSPAQTTEMVYHRLETLTGEDHDTFGSETLNSWRTWNLIKQPAIPLAASCEKPLWTIPAAPPKLWCGNLI